MLFLCISCLIVISGLQVQTEMTCQRIQELETQASSDLELRNNKIDELTRSNEELKHQVQSQSKVGETLVTPTCCAQLIFSLPPLCS